MAPARPRLGLLIALLLLSLATPATAQGQDCTNGCLRCSSNGICLLCDASNFYTRNGYTCIQSPIANCSTTIDGVTCAQCKPGFFYNATQNLCLAVPAASQRSNCLYYNSTMQCVQCNSTSFFADPTTGGCTVLKNGIQNCQNYASDGVCTKCTYQYLLANNTCNQVAVVPNCQLYSYDVSCSTCQPNFVLQRNLYQINIITNYNALLSFYSILVASVATNQTTNPQYKSVCAPKVTNCATISPFNNCTTCLTGYFNNNGSCQLNPAQPVPQCVVYRDQVTCITCNQTFYFVNQTCKAVTTIQNCLVYDVAANKKCLQCSPLFYSNGTNCLLRTNQISNCLVLSNSSDTCAVCATSFWLTPDASRCLSPIQFCQTPLFVLQGSAYIANCGKCLNQFYISTTITGGSVTSTCVLPTQLIQGCLEYQQATLCNLCDNGYYLVNFVCQQHDPNIVSKINCTLYSTNQLNLCSGCTSSQYLYALLNYCQPITAQTPNCFAYTNAVCSKCNPGYYVFTDPTGAITCQATNITSCVLTAVTSNVCLACDSLTGTMPNVFAVNNLCVQIPMGFTANCQNFTINIERSLANCVSCFAPYYPLLMNSVFFQFCYPFSEFQYIGSGITQDQIKALGNCLAFDLATKQCLYCDPGSITPFISNVPAGICNSACTWGDEVVLTFAFTATFPSSFFQCSQVSLIHMFGDSSTNCMRADYDVSAVVLTSSEKQIQQFCAQCLPNYIPVVYNYTSNYYTHYDYLPMAAFSNRLSATSYFSPLIKRPLFANCRLWTTTFMASNAIPFVATNMVDSAGNPLTSYSASSTYFVYNWANFQNCEVIIGELQSSGFYAYGCAKCAFQYTGPAITSTGGTNFLYNCKQMAACDTTVYYAGIGSHDPLAQLYLFVSCHACIDRTTIVTITSVKPWTYQSDPTKALNFNIQTLGYYPSNSCYMPGVITNNVQYFPQNCLIQQLINNQALQQYTPALSIVPNPACVACAPGYQPTVSSIVLPGEIYHFITACTQIANCASSNTFNACDQCENGYVLKTNSSVAGNTTGYPCVVNTIVGCQIGAPNGICAQCKPGYVLNLYGFCDTVLMQKCSSFGNMTPYTTAYLYLTVNPFPQGCLICQTGSYAVRLPFPVTYCVSSSATASTTLTPNFFISNCLYYGLNSAYAVTCVTCATGYSPTNTLNNCFLRNSIPNCLVYASTSTLANVICFQCNNGFYLNGNACFAGEINNCLVYMDRFNCQTCAPGFVATLAYFSTYILCLDVSASLQNCTSFDPNQALYGYLNCTQCNANNYLSTFGVPIKTCSGFPLINNCLSYDIQPTFARSSFFCLACTQPYYTSQGFPSRCLSRTYYPILNCNTYAIATDTCLTCIVGFYLSTDKLSCVQNPNGIIGCRIYANITSCQECDGTANYYVTNGNCLPLSQGYAVTNCWAYSSQSICLQCIPGYQYINGACTKLTIQNCATYQLNGICSQCATGYTLISNACYSANVANCQVYATPTSCGVCTNGYYSNNGVCLPPTNIPNCVSYNTLSTCATCTSGYVLSADATTCTALTAAQQTIVGSDPCGQFTPVRGCDYCQLGYYYNPATSACTQCQTQPTGACAVCYFMNPSICLICSAGYFMNNKSTCAPNTNNTVVVVAAENPNSDFYQSNAFLATTLPLLAVLVRLVSL